MSIFFRWVEITNQIHIYIYIYVYTYIYIHSQDSTKIISERFLEKPVPGQWPEVVSEGVMFFFVGGRNSPRSVGKTLGMEGPGPLFGAPLLEPFKRGYGTQ